MMMRSKHLALDTLDQTYQLAVPAKASRKQMKKKESRLLALGTEDQITREAPVRGAEDAAEDDRERAAVSDARGISMECVSVWDRG